MLSSFSDLSAGTEFAHYKDPQWRFLLRGDEVTGFVMVNNEHEDTNEDKGDAKNKFDSCLLKVDLDNDTVGYGMVLVRKSRRRRGLARVIFEKASQCNNNEEEGKRHVLAVCSAMASPLYRQLGYKDSGVISTLTCSISDILNSVADVSDPQYLRAYDGKEFIEMDDNFTLLVNGDAKATGRSRRDRMRLLLDGHTEGSRSTVAMYGAFSDRLTTAVARQDCVDGPLFIGPMNGNERFVIPLMHALVGKHVEDGERSEVNDTPVQMMITDHPNLVAKLLEMKGMTKLGEGPSMTLDGKSVYHNGDGSYLAMMHPTLG